MDFKFPSSKAPQVELSDADFNIQVNSAEDFDMDKFSFSDGQDDLGGILQDKVGNYDYLDLDEEDLHTIPSPDVDASAVPEVEEVLTPETIGRGQGATARVALSHDENLRQAGKTEAKIDVESVLVEARKAMTSGVHGKAVLEHLASKFPRSHVEAAWPTLKTYANDQWLLGNVILEPELFASCPEMRDFLKAKNVGASAKIIKACSECTGCPYRKANNCTLFDKTLVKSMPDSPLLLQAYVGDKKVADLALRKMGSATRAMARLFASKASQRKMAKRPQVRSAVPSYRVPEPRTSAETPREAILGTVGDLIDQGLRADQIRTHTANYLGSASFEGVWREVVAQRGFVSWDTFGACRHPLLLKADVPLKPGKHCTGCMHNYGDHCHLNKKTFTEPFTTQAAEINAMDVVREHEKPFVGEKPSLEFEPSTPKVPGMEASEMDLTEEFEV